MAKYEPVSRFLIDPIAITCCKSTLMLENLPNLLQNMSLEQEFSLTQRLLHVAVNFGARKFTKFIAV